MAERESDILAAKRWDDLELLQEHYAVFEDFLFDVMVDLLGFDCTWMQKDIGEYLENGPLYRMIQAQRGEAKTTITAIYAVWRLIHNPKTRVLIVSAGSDMATQIANWIIQIIVNMPELECLKPDTAFGDRSSVKAFDVHHSLRGPEKSPSVACLGITANLQGYRSDLLIADDIESKKNSGTAVQREKINEITKDFTSICSLGDIIYLGTPQSTDSIYNSLPQRGYGIRIWPGRYPTKEELPNYNGFLAPSLIARMEADPSLQTGGGPLGDRGKPTDPGMMSEETLTKKEIDQGKAYFQLQHMLDTALTDKDRYPLKLKDIIFAGIPLERCPVIWNWSRNEDNRIIMPQGFPIQDKLYRVSGHGEEYGNFTGTHMYVDPSGGGQNADELAYAVTKFLGGKIYLVDFGGMPGGLGEAQLKFMTDVAIKWMPNTIHIEENFGKGAFRHVWQTHLLAELQKQNKRAIGMEDVWESGQKELRIIDVLEPVIGAQRLVVDIDLIEKDWQTCQKYPLDKRPTYSLFFQMARLTREKGALIHDDRLDAVAGSCRFWVNHLVLDEKKVAAQIKQDNYNKLIANPLGNGRVLPGFRPSTAWTVMDKFKRI